MMKDNKTLSPKLLNKYLRDTIKNEYNMKITEREMNKILDGIKIGIDRLIADCYSFKLLGFHFKVYHKTPKVYRNVRNGKIEISKPHFSLKITVPRSYQRKLKEETRYKSDEEPELMGVTEEEIKDLNIF